MERDRHIDFLRGMAILLVVLGHAAAHFDYLYIPYNIIYSIHMPLLFFLSGYVAEYKLEQYTEVRSGRELFGICIDKTRSLMLPFFVWVAIILVFNKSLSFETYVYTISNSGGLWFFPVLYGISILHILKTWISIRLKKESLLCNGLLLMGIYVSIVLIAYLTRYTYVVNMLSYFFSYFAGVLVFKYPKIRYLFGSPYIVAVSAMIYVVMYRFFDFNNTEYKTQVIRIILGICATILLWQVSLRICTDKPIPRTFVWFGQSSVAIYLLHNFLNKWYVILEITDNMVVGIGILLSCGLLVCAICSVACSLICKSRLLGLILFGKRWKK